MEYRRVLVVTDNSYLASHFLKIVDHQQFENVSFSFAISPYSSLSEFEKVLSKEVIVLNLKDNEEIEYLKENFDLIFSLHCKQLFPKNLIDRIKCINIHPGYNPVNRGWYPQVFSIINKLPIGATIHEIDEKLDHGNIIARSLVPQYAWDTSKDVYDRVVEKEIELLKKNLQQIINNDYQTIRPESEGKLFLKKDFNDLLELNLNEKGTYRELIDRLRALSHGDFKNAYFIDTDTQKKVFLSLRLYVEDEK